MGRPMSYPMENNPQWDRLPSHGVPHRIDVVHDTTMNMWGTLWRTIGYTIRSPVVYPLQGCTLLVFSVGTWRAFRRPFMGVPWETFGILTIIIVPWESHGKPMGLHSKPMGGHEGPMDKNYK